MNQFALVTVDKSTKNAIQILERVEGVEYVEPNYIYKTSNAYDYVPRDKKFKSQWGLLIEEKIDRERERVTRGADESLEGMERFMILRMQQEISSLR